MEVIIRPCEKILGHNVYIIDRPPGPCREGDVSSILIKEGNEWIWKMLKRDGGDVEPTFVLPNHALKPLLNAILETGIRPPNMSFNEGMLAAAKYHLADMRTLLGLNRQLNRGTPTPRGVERIKIKPNKDEPQKT